MSTIVTNIGEDSGLIVRRFQKNHQGASNDVSGYTAVESGTVASAGTTTTAYLAISSASTIDGYYNGMIIKFVNGSGDLRKIIDYVGNTRTASFEAVASTDTDASSTYAIYNIGDIFVENGTAVAGTNDNTNITLASSDTVSSVDNFYKDMYLVITGGTGSGQTRRITAYNGTNKVATVNTFETVPVATSSTYEIYNLGSVINNYAIESGLAQGPFDSTTEIDLQSNTATTSEQNNFYNDMVFRFTGGRVPAKTTHRITNYVGSTQTVTITPGLDANGDVDATSEYEIYKVTDTNSPVSVADNSTFTLTSPSSSVVNYYKGWYVELIAGPGAGQVRKIVNSEADNDIIVSPVWTGVTPTTGTSYVLYPAAEAGIIFDEAQNEFRLVSTRESKTNNTAPTYYTEEHLRLRVAELVSEALLKLPISAGVVTDYGVEGALRYDTGEETIQVYQGTSKVWAGISGGGVSKGFISGAIVSQGTAANQYKITEGFVEVDGTLVKISAHITPDTDQTITPGTGVTIPPNTDSGGNKILQGELIYLCINNAGVIQGYDNEGIAALVPAYDADKNGWYITDGVLYRMVGMLYYQKFLATGSAAFIDFLTVGQHNEIKMLYDVNVMSELAASVPNYISANAYTTATLSNDYNNFMPTSIKILHLLCYNGNNNGMHITPNGATTYDALVLAGLTTRINYQWMNADIPMINNTRRIWIEISSGENRVGFRGYTYER